MSSTIELSEVSGVQIVKAGTEGPNILFLHDSGQPPAGMKRHLRQLAEAGKVIAPNLFDLASNLRHKGIAPSLEDIVYELDQLDLIDRQQRTGIVAVSVGAGFAWEYAAQKPKKVDWIITGSPLGYPLHRSLFSWLVEFIRVSRQTSTIPEELNTDEGLVELKRNFKKDPRAVLDIWKMAINMDCQEQLKTIKSPVDLLWGENDNFTPIWSGEKMSTLLPQARLEVVSKYYHYWYQFEPRKLINPAIQQAKTT